MVVVFEDMANDDSDGDGWDSGTSDTPSMKPKPKLISSAFYMECEQTSVDASPCGMTRQQATTWTTAFYGTGGAWTLQTAWKRANDTITSANVLDKIRAGIGLPSNYGDPFRVGAPQKPFTEGTGNREVYALKVNVESTMKETMEKTAKGLETLQKRTVPTHGRLRAQMTHYVMRFFGLTRSYYWTIEGGKKTRGIWVRGTIVGIYFNRKLRRFGGLVLFKHDKAVFDDPDANESMKLQAPFLLALPDLDGFDEHPLRSKWPPVPAPVEQRLVRVHERCIARGYFYVTKPPRVAIVWAWVDDIILAVDAAPPDRHKLAVRHKTRVVDEGGRSVTRTGMYARLHKVPPHFYVRVEEVNKRELTVTVDYGTKFWRILHEELRPPWSQNGKRVMNHNECQAAYVHIVHDLPDNMMVPVSGGPITWYADAERHDIMVTYNQLVIYNKFQNDTWLSTNASYISKAGVKVVRDRLHDEGNKTDAQKNAVTALLRSTIVAFVHAGVAASAVRAAAMGAHGDLDRGALVKRVSYVMAVRRMRTAMWAAQSVGAAYWLRSNPKFKELEDQDADHDSDSSDEGAVTNDEGFLEDKFTTARSGVGKGYTFGFSAMEGGPTSMRGIMPKLKKTFIRCMWKHTASRRFAVDYTDAVDRMAPVDDNPSRMMRLGTLDAYQVQLFNRYLGVVHDIRAWGSFVMGSRDLVPGPESVLTYAATNTKRLVGPPNAVLPVVPALEFDRLEGLNEAYVPVTRSVANGTALPVHIASKVASNAFPMPAKASFVEQKLFGPNQRRGNAILEALGFSEATHVCNRLSAQYPVHVPFALYETSNNVSKTIPRARFMQLYVDALFWVAPIRSSNSGGVVLVEYKVRHTIQCGSTNKKFPKQEICLFLRPMLYWGRASPLPDPALRAEMNLIRTLYSYWRAALLGGVRERGTLPRKLINHPMMPYYRRWRKTDPSWCPTGSTTQARSSRHCSTLGCSSCTQA